MTSEASSSESLQFLPGWVSWSGPSCDTPSQNWDAVRNLSYVERPHVVSLVRSPSGAPSWLPALNSIHAGCSSLMIPDDCNHPNSPPDTTWKRGTASQRTEWWEINCSFQVLFKYLVICYLVTDNWNRFPPPHWDTAFQVYQPSSCCRIQWWAFLGFYVVWSPRSIPSWNGLFPWLLWPLTLLAFSLPDTSVSFALSFTQPLNLGMSQSSLGLLSPSISMWVSLGDLI